MRPTERRRNFVLFRSGIPMHKLTRCKTHEAGMPTPLIDTRRRITTKYVKTAISTLHSTHPSDARWSHYSPRENTVRRSRDGTTLAPPGLRGPMSRRQAIVSIRQGSFEISHLFRKRWHNIFLV